MADDGNQAAPQGRPVDQEDQGEMPEARTAAKAPGVLGFLRILGILFFLVAAGWVLLVNPFGSPQLFGLLIPVWLYFALLSIGAVAFVVGAFMGRAVIGMPGALIVGLLFAGQRSYSGSLLNLAIGAWTFLCGLELVLSSQRFARMWADITMSSDDPNVRQAFAGYVRSYLIFAPFGLLVVGAVAGAVALLPDLIDDRVQPVLRESLEYRSAYTVLAVAGALIATVASLRLLMNLLIFKNMRHVEDEEEPEHDGKIEKGAPA